MVDGEVNGKPVKVMFDTGSAISMIPKREADRLGLVLRKVEGAHTYGIGGASDLYVAQLKGLKIDQFAKEGLELAVTGDQDVASDASIVLGDDFFSQVDTEIDLPNRVVRLFQQDGCAPAQLVYWGAAYSQAPLLTWGRDAPEAETEVFVNGKRVRAQLDTGAWASIIDVKAADAAGVDRTAAGAGPGTQTQVAGMGHYRRDSFVGRFATFALGDEKVNNVRLQVMDLTSDFKVTETGSNIPTAIDDTASMLVGADFFHAHRVYIDVKDHLILFSYSGGPVFSPVAAASTAK
jgi:predicted aspartyl protease